MLEQYQAELEQKRSNLEYFKKDLEKKKSSPLVPLLIIFLGVIGLGMFMLGSQMFSNAAGDGEAFFSLSLLSIPIIIVLVPVLIAFLVIIFCSSKSLSDAEKQVNQLELEIKELEQKIFDLSNNEIKE